jgi:serine/threonine protein kinase
MDATTSPHPTDETLHAYGLGKLDDPAAESVNAHLEGCVACRRRTAEMSSDSFLSKLRGGRSVGGSASGLEHPASAQSLAGSGALFPAGTLPPELAEHKDYEVIRELGRGGMGVVYLVRNRLMGRHEVLKVMGRHLVERPEVGERFLREIRAVASLRHPNIVAAHHAFHVEGSIAFTMEYVEGYDLSKMVKARGPLPVAHACLFTHQAALGLQHAYEEGMVHRDIKPGNLMVSRRGEKAVVKVLDFGLAKAAREGQFDSALTHAGQMLGTPDYIAPEQIVDAQKADVRADIYSLGCTLYYLLTGGPPFRATSLYDLLQAHHSMDARLLNFVRPEVPTELAALVAKMMAKEPERRFKTPAGVSEALAPFYKKGNAALKPAKQEVSQIATTETRHSAPGMKPTPPAPAPVPQPRKPTDTPRPESMWASLIDSSKPESRVENTSPEPASSGLTPRPPWRSLPAIAAASLFGFIVLGIFIYISIDKNGLKVTAYKEDASPSNGNGKGDSGHALTAEGKASQDGSQLDRPILAKAKASQDGSQLDRPILTQLNERLTMSFPQETPLEDVLKYIQSNTQSEELGLPSGIPIYVDPIGLLEAEKTLASPVTLDLEGIALKDSLRLVLQQIDLTYSVTNGILLISSPKVIEERKEQLNRIRVAADDKSPGTKKILTQLNERLTMSFPQETPLKDVLKYIQSNTQSEELDLPSGIMIYTDPVGLLEAEKTLDSPVILDLEGVPLKATLTLILNQLDLDYCIHNGMLFISTPAGVKRELAVPHADPGKNTGQVDDGRFIPPLDGRDRSVGSPAQPIAGKPPVPPVAASASLQARTQWKGVLSRLDGRDWGDVFPVEISIGKRERDDFEGTYSTISGKNSFKLKGRIDGDKISWEMVEPIIGSFQYGDRLTMQGTIREDRVDVFVDWKKTQGDRCHFKGFFLKVAESGDIFPNLPVAAERKPDANPAPGDDLLAAGSVWCGLGSHFKPASYPSNCPTVIKITKREENSFEGTYGLGDERKVNNPLILAIKGTVGEGQIVWTCYGNAQFAGTPIRGVIRGDRIDVEFNYSSAIGLPATGRIVYVRDAGTADVPAMGGIGGLPTSAGERPDGQIRNPPVLPTEIRGGSWTVEGDELAQSTRAKGAVLLFGDREWSNYNFKFRAQTIDGRNGFKGKFHARGQGDECEFALGYYSNKLHDVSFESSGRWVRLEGMTKPGRIEPRRWYEVLIEVRRAEYRCFLDGTLLFQGRLNNITSGRVGLATWDNTARFRDIEVISPEGKILWRGLPELPASAGRTGGSPTNASEPPHAPVDKKP